jgi:molecular chaperone Hsp33
MSVSVLNDCDRALGFFLPARNARGRLVRLGPVMQSILTAHGYPPLVEALLAEALVITALLGAMLKEGGGQMTMQAQTEGGPIALLVCDYKDGEVRGYIKHDADMVAALAPDADIAALFGKGYLAITFDQAVSGERYQGIVPLEGKTLSDAIESYFSQSEQIPSLVRVAVGAGRAGGMLLQHLAEGEEGRDRIHTRLDHPEWAHVAIVGGTIKAEELLDDDLPLETIVWRLFNEESEVRVLGGASLSKGCRCDPDHIRSVIERFEPQDRAEMADAAGIINVECEFCARSFPISSV